MSVLDLHALAQVSAGRVLNTMAEGLVIAALSWIVVRVFGARNSGTRFAIWFWSLLAIAALPFLARPSSQVFLSSPAFSSAWPHARLTISSAAAFYLFMIWAAVVAVLLGRVGISLRHVRQLRRNSQEVDRSTLDASLVEVLAQFGSQRRVKLCVSDRVRVPAALGFFRPAIVVPSWLLHELSVEELKAILLHELAHLQRWDDWSNLAQKIVKAFFFFHPAVWWIERSLALEREMACDDLVVAHTANPRAYAASLVSLAEKILAKKVQGGRALTLAQAVLGRMRQTSLRIAQILNVHRPSGTRVWRPALAAMAAISVALFLAVPYAPELVTVRDHAHPALAADAGPMKSLPAGTTATSAHAGANTPKPTLVRFNPSSLAVPVRAKRMGSRQVGVQNRLRTASVKHSDILDPPMVVFVQSAAFDTANPAVWRVTIWRVTIGSSGESEVQTTIVMSSI
jgi:beta-lactamase regulating signal transducer with metallopeptidase domain